MLCPYHGEHVATCLFGAMSCVWNPIFSIIFSFPNNHSFDDFNQGLFWSILCFVTQFLLHHRTAPVLSLPSLCSCQGSWFHFPDSWPGWAALLPYLACRWSFLGLSLMVSTALEVLKLSDISFEMQSPKPARPQLEDFVQRSLEQKNYFTSYWLFVWVCSSQNDISLLWNRRTLLSHVQLVIQHYPYFFLFAKLLSTQLFLLKCSFLH